MNTLVIVGVWGTLLWSKSSTINEANKKPKVNNKKDDNRNGSLIISDKASVDKLLEIVPISATVKKNAAKATTKLLGAIKENDPDGLALKKDTKFSDLLKKENQDKNFLK